MAPKAKPAAAPAAKAEPKAKAEAKKKPRKEEDEKSKIPVVAQPDKTLFNESLQKIQEDIDKMQKQQQGLTQRINERSGGKDEFFAKKAEIRAKLDEFSGKMNELQAQKDEINKVVGEKKQEGRELRQQVTKMKKSIGYTNEGEIDDRIASIEFKLWTDSISLKEEKELLKEIQELKRNRPKVSKVNEMEASLGTFDAGMSMKDKVSKINEEMFKYREGKREVQAQLAELMDGRKTQLGDVPQLITERDEIGQKIQAKIKEKNELRDEFRSSEREFNNYLGELRRVRQEKAMEERAAREKDYRLRQLAKEADKLDEVPYIQEITLIEQTISWCKSLTQSKPEQKEEKNKTTIANPDGMEVLIKKEDRDEEFYFAPTKGKKATKQKGKSGASKNIKHNAETFRLFDKLKLDAPVTTEDIPPLLEKLETQLQDYEAKTKVWEEKREEMKRRILEDGVLPADDEKKEAKEEEDEAAEEKDPEKAEEAEKAEDEAGTDE